MAVHAQSIDLVVSNPTPVQRVQVVEVDAKKVYQRLGRAYGSPLIVRNVFKQQVVYQLTADSLLLVEAAVSPQRKAVFHITCGMPRAFQSAVDGRLYPWRVDDFAWENDRCAYRAYGPALQQTGEKAFGFDVWLKSVPGLVVAERYAKVYEANQEEKRLRSLGKQQEADSISLNNSLHRDHGCGYLRSRTPGSIRRTNQRACSLSLSRHWHVHAGCSRLQYRQESVDFHCCELLLQHK